MKLTRRKALAFGSAGMLAGCGPAQAVEGPTPWVRTTRFVKDEEARGVRQFEHVHEGTGTTGVKFFRFDGAPAPANFLVYDFPPGASEGVHVHRLGDTKLGSFDEYYYVVSGSGRMRINGETVEVRAGDHVFTPLDVHHGIENTSSNENLKVFLTFIQRT